MDKKNSKNVVYPIYLQVHYSKLINASEKTFFREKTDRKSKRYWFITRSTYICQCLPSRFHLHWNGQSEVYQWKKKKLRRNGVQVPCTYYVKGTWHALVKADLMMQDILNRYERHIKNWSNWWIFFCAVQYFILPLVIWNMLKLFGEACSFVLIMVYAPLNKMYL